MKEKQVRLGFAMCGSFCTLKKVVGELERMSRDFDILPIMSEITYNTDTRFGNAKDFIYAVEDICKKEVIHTVVGAEPIGPKNLTDVMVIAPCTGNTLAKIAHGITDTSVTMAAKSHIRNNKPLVIALATNDALAGSAKNIGTLMNFRNVHFVPFSQDDCNGKPRSCIADMTLIEQTVRAAIDGIQIQPIIK